VAIDTLWSSKGDANRARDEARDSTVANRFEALIEQSTKSTEYFKELPADRYCWTSMRWLPSGSLIAARVGPPSMSKGAIRFGASMFNRAIDCRAQVGDLDIERRTSGRSGLDVAGRAGVRSSDASGDLHEGPSPISIEQVA